MSCLFLALCTMALFGICFANQRTHVLTMLIALEGAMLGLLTFYYFFSVGAANNSTLFLLLLTFAACEAGLGLSILVTFLRLHGNDMVSSFSVAKW